MGARKNGPVSRKTGKRPFELDPPIKTYQYTAYALGAALPVGKEAGSILDNNYIQLESARSYLPQHHLLRFAPYIGPTTFAENGLGVQSALVPRTRRDLISALVRSISHGFFVRLLVDEYFVPERWSHLTTHRMHDILVTGIDLAKKDVTIVGYCRDRRYRESHCSVRELCAAYFSVPHHPGVDRFIAFKFQPRTAIKLNLGLIQESLVNFIEAKPSPRTKLPDPSDGAPGGGAYGLAAFDYVSGYIEIQARNSRMDRRPFSTLLDHALLMQRRAQRVSGHIGDPDRFSREAPLFSENCYTAKKLKLLSMVSIDSFKTERVKLMLDLCRRLKGLSAECAECVQAMVPSSGAHQA
jgi:hypothetical protein